MWSKVKWKLLGCVRLFATPRIIQSMKLSSQNTRVGSLSFFQIFPMQGSNPGLPHCRWILYQPRHKESPRILEWIAYPFSSGSSPPRDQTWVSCISSGFFTNWAIREAQKYTLKTQKYTLISSNHIWKKVQLYENFNRKAESRLRCVCDQKKSKSWVGANWTRFRVGFEAELIFQEVLTSVNIRCSLRQQIIKWIIIIIIIIWGTHQVLFHNPGSIITSTYEEIECKEVKYKGRERWGQFTPRQSEKRAHILYFLLWGGKTTTELLVLTI